MIARHLITVATEATPEVAEVLASGEGLPARHHTIQPATLDWSAAQVKAMAATEAVTAVSYIKATELDELFTRDKRKTVRMAILHRSDMSAELAVRGVAWLRDIDELNDAPASVLLGRMDFDTMLEQLTGLPTWFYSSMRYRLSDVLANRISCSADFDKVISTLPLNSDGVTRLMETLLMRNDADLKWLIGRLDAEQRAKLFDRYTQIVTAPLLEALFQLGDTASLAAVATGRMNDEAITFLKERMVTGDPAALEMLTHKWDEGANSAFLDSRVQELTSRQAVRIINSGFMRPGLVEQAFLDIESVPKLRFTNMLKALSQGHLDSWGFVLEQLGNDQDQYHFCDWILGYLRQHKQIRLQLLEDRDLLRTLRRGGVKLDSLMADLLDVNSDPMVVREVVEGLLGESKNGVTQGASRRLLDHVPLPDDLVIALAKEGPDPNWLRNEAAVNRPTVEILKQVIVECRTPGTIVTNSVHTEDLLDELIELVATNDQLAQTIVEHVELDEEHLCRLLALRPQTAVMLLTRQSAPNKLSYTTRQVVLREAPVEPMWLSNSFALLSPDECELHWLDLDVLSANQTQATKILANCTISDELLVEFLHKDLRGFVEWCSGKLEANPFRQDMFDETFNPELIETQFGLGYVPMLNQSERGRRFLLDSEAFMRAMRLSGRTNRMQWQENLRVLYQLLHQELGDDKLAWTNVHAMIDTWPGSLGSLAIMAKVASGTA